MQVEKSRRIDIVDLKVQMLKKIGTQRFKHYLFCLNRFINQKLSKGDFHRSCYRLLGRENLPLHNQIIQAILKNACSAKSPPPVHEGGLKKGTVEATRSLVFVDDGHGRGHGQGSIITQNRCSVAPIWSNGVVLPMSPRKGTILMHDRKLRDQLSSLGPTGKVDSTSHQSTATKDHFAKTVENGELTPCDFERPVEEPKELAKQPVKEDIFINELVGVPNNLSVVEDGEEVEQTSHSKFSRRPLLAPLGIPFCSASVGGSRKPVHATSTPEFFSYCDSCELFDSETLRRYMEQIAKSQGLGGVTTQCPNVLNHMLDVYLKRLIKSCVELVGARSADDPAKYPIQAQHAHRKLINGLWTNSNLHFKRDCHLISMLDFKVAMELNPQQLGEDWPLLLEKISMKAFQE